MPCWGIVFSTFLRCMSFHTAWTHSGHSAAQRPVLTPPRPLRCASLGWYAAVSLGGSHETTRVHRPSWRRCGCLAACRARAAGRAYAARRGVDDRAPCCGVCGGFFRAFGELRWVLLLPARRCVSRTRPPPPPARSSDRNHRCKKASPLENDWSFHLVRWFNRASSVITHTSSGTCS